MTRLTDMAAVADAWQPEPIEDHDVLTAATGAAAAGIWNTEPPSSLVPPLWHWFGFLEWPEQRRLGPDGHPADGAFMPPLRDRRRMFAGGSCAFHAPLRYDVPTHRTRYVANATPKRGRSGDLLFVTVRSQLRQHDDVCVVEDQNLVYRSGASAADLRSVTPSTTPPQVDTDAEAHVLHTDPTLLFRMSALTGNPHRIHYDQAYAVDVEHYPTLVVPGPLLVLHLLELIRRRQSTASPVRVGYRLHAPVYVGEPLAAVADPEADGRQPLRIATARHQQHASVDASW